MKQALAPEVVQFIKQHVDSVEMLEVLLLLESKPDHDWGVEDVDAVIRSSQASLQKRLEHLVALGIGVKLNSTRYRYGPISPEVRRLAENLISAFRNYRIEVIELIYAKPLQSILSFSDAFKIRKETKDG